MADFPGITRQLGMILERFGFWIACALLVAGSALLYTGISFLSSADRFPDGRETERAIASKKQPIPDFRGSDNGGEVIPGLPTGDAGDGDAFVITTDPVGAVVYVDARYVGASPVRDIVLNEGRHLISVRKRDYARIDTFVTIGPLAAPVRLTLRPDSALYATSDVDPAIDDIGFAVADAMEPPVSAIGQGGAASGGNTSTSSTTLESVEPMRSSRTQTPVRRKVVEAPPPATKRPETNRPIQRRVPPTASASETGQGNDRRPEAIVVAGVEEDAPRGIAETATDEVDSIAIAREERQLALALQRTREEEARKRIADSLDIVNSRNEQLYHYARGTADALFSRGSYEEALEKYTEMLGLKPEDPFATQRIADSNAELRKQREIREQQEALVADGVYSVSDVPPQLIGGAEKLYQKIRYPKRAWTAGVEGRVFVTVIVDEEGRVHNAAVVRGLGYGCDEEVLRVIRSARFEPGRVAGKKVKVRHTLYVDFKIDV